ncbi:hypothetical protein Nmel_010438 [Mimus melanotis]
MDFVEFDLPEKMIANDFAKYCCQVKADNGETLNRESANNVESVERTLKIIIQKCLCSYVMSRGLCDLTEVVCPAEERALSISSNLLRMIKLALGGGNVLHSDPAYSSPPQHLHRFKHTPRMCFLKYGISPSLSLVVHVRKIHKQKTHNFRPLQFNENLLEIKQIKDFFSCFIESSAYTVPLSMRGQFPWRRDGLECEPTITFPRKPRQSPGFACPNSDAGPALLNTIQPEKSLQHSLELCLQHGFLRFQKLTNHLVSQSGVIVVIKAIGAHRGRRERRIGKHFYFCPLVQCAVLSEYEKALLEILFVSVYTPFQPFTAAVKYYTPKKQHTWLQAGASISGVYSQSLSPWGWESLCYLPTCLLRANLSPAHLSLEE